MSNDQEERLRYLQEEFNSFKNLVQTRGWKRLVEIADEQIKARAPSAYGRTENLLEVTAKEFDRGEISGILLFTRLADNYVAELTNDIDNLEKELAYATGTRTTDDGDGSTLDGDDRDDGEFEPAV